MVSRLPKLGLVLALACSLGLHWAFLQSVAWVEMVVSYSQAAPLSEALAKTFDGKHPCCLCKEIAKGKQAEEKAPCPSPVKKFEFSYNPSGFVFAAPGAYYEVSWPTPVGRSLRRSPPVPPPKLVMG